MPASFSIPAAAAARHCGRSRAIVACSVPTARFRARRSRPSGRVRRAPLRAVPHSHHGKRPKLERSSARPIEQQNPGRTAGPGGSARAHRRNRSQPDQSRRRAARNGIHQLAETDLDLLCTLRGVYLRRSLVSVEESGCDARTKRMTKETLMSPEFDKRIPAALLILRFFLATFLLQWSIEKL